MTGTVRYGRRKAPAIIAQFNALRQAIRAEGTPGIQSALDAVEEHIDAAYQWTAERQTALDLAKRGIDQWASCIDSEYSGTGQFVEMMAEVDAARADLARLEQQP